MSIKVAKANNYKGLCIRHTFAKREKTENASAFETHSGPGSTGVLRFYVRLWGWFCARVRVFTPNFSALRKKAAAKCNDLPGPLVYKVQAVYNKKQQNLLLLWPARNAVSRAAEAPPFRKERVLNDPIPVVLAGRRCGPACGGGPDRQSGLHLVCRGRGGRPGRQLAGCFAAGAVCRVCAGQLCVPAGHPAAGAPPAARRPQGAGCRRQPGPHRPGAHPHLPRL